MKKIFGVLVFCVLWVCQAGAQQYLLNTTTVQVEVVTDSVDIPWNIAWGPDHQLWITDGPSIKKIDPKTRAIKSIFTSPRTNNGFTIDNGLGLTFHPDFFNTPEVFVLFDTCFYYSGCGYARLYKYTYSFLGDSLYNETLLFGYGHAGEHVGGRLITTSDDKILLTTADYWYSNLPSDPSGKTLRFNLDGTVPSDNPFTDYTWTLGHRNPQGLLQAPNGNIYASEHGQWTFDQDELNVIVKGGNYGWPAYDGFSCSNFSPDTCTSGTFTHIPPIDAGANPPSGIDYYDHPSIPEFSNSIIEATLNKQAFIVYNLDSPGTSVVAKSIYFDFEFGRLRDVCTAPNGKVYMITNDRDYLYYGPPATSDAMIREFYNIAATYCTPTSSVVQQQVCQGDSILIDGNYYSTAQNVVEITLNAAGCDSLIIHVLEESPLTITSLPAIEICQGDSTAVYGNYINTAGLYYDTLVSSVGCDSILETAVTVNDLPAVVINSFSPDSICEAAAAIVLPAGTPPGGSYSGTGVGGGNFDPGISGLGTFSVVYTYTDVNSCTSSDTTNITVEACIGYGEALKELGILVYPNPNTGQFTIQKPSGFNRPVSVKLLDAASKLIMEEHLSAGKEKILMDISRYGKGIYYLQLIVDGKVYVRQIQEN